MADIKANTINKMMQQFSNTTNRFNVCIDKPAKFNRSAANTILRLNNQIPTQLLRTNPALHCQLCLGSRPEHATGNRQQQTTHIIHLTTTNQTNKIQFDEPNGICVININPLTEPLTAALKLAQLKCALPNALIFKREGGNGY